MVDPIVPHGTRLREELGSVPQDLAPRRGTAPTWRRAGRAVPPCSAPRPAPPGRRASALPAAPPPPSLLPAKFVYVEPSRRVKEILEEELYFQKEACHVKHPAAVALEGIWSLKKNFSIGSLKPVSQNRNGLLLQPQLYSRHAGKKSKSQ
uniref:Chromosome 11 open reading frame 97 n=1 Tax=Aquila chrysaetos chrysaetos TaxID=223781 RepID=A0A663EM28_AQUCH